MFLLDLKRSNFNFKAYSKPGKELSIDSGFLMVVSVMNICIPDFEVQLKIVLYHW
jgi:hypothetical protein